MLADLGDDARVIAGGTAMLLALRQRLLQPQHLVSLARLEELRGIRWDPSRGLRIGALALHSEVADSPEVRKHVPMLAGLAARMANPQVRNQGTLGGNLCYADPATDPPAALLTLDARVLLRGSGGERELPIGEFLVDYYTTAMEPGELLVEVRIPAPPDGWDGRYKRFLRTAAEHRPLVNVAVNARRRGPVCDEIRIAIGASTPVPVRITRAEAFLSGRTVTPEVLQEAGSIVARDIQALDDARGSADYRRQMAAVTTRRVLGDLFGVQRVGETV